MPTRVLIIDDDPSILDALRIGLKDHAINAKTVDSGEEGISLLGSDNFDAVVTDLQLGGMDGIEVCKRAAEEICPGMPAIVMTAYAKVDAAVAAIRAGAYDFFTKPLDVDVVAVTLQRAFQHRHLAQEVIRLRKRVEEKCGFGEIIGKSTAMQKVFDFLFRAAESDATVLITGESGTGKELVARALHREGLRKEGPFIAINCAAMPESLLESELFGHAKGAFTDARQEKPGLLLQANKGILFLDEIGDMPLPMQAKLLRALQERSVRPVGGQREVSFDVRVVVATNRDLEHEVEENRFREDLFFRINVIHIDVPPLRSRGNDKLLLAQHLLEKTAQATGTKIVGISREAAEKMISYDWPGNVRELQNCIERAVAMTRFDQISVDDLPVKIKNYKPGVVMITAEDPAELVSLEEIERRYILRVLQACAENRTAAAKILGVDRKTLRRKLARWGLKGE